MKVSGVLLEVNNHKLWYSLCKPQDKNWAKGVTHLFWDPFELKAKIFDKTSDGMQNCDIIAYRGLSKSM